MIADLKPGFVRFPGGCIVEGRNLGNRYQWKTTVGPVEERKMIMNRWNIEIASRQAPDYFQSFGLGFFEYFLLAEDLGAEPLPYGKTAMKETLESGNKDDFNSIADPKAIYPLTTPVKVAGRKINAEAEPLSVNVFIIDFKPH